MIKASNLSIVGGGLLGLTFGYFRHLLVLSIHNKFPDVVLINRAKGASIFLIFGATLFIAGLKKVKSDGAIKVDQ